jgi:hypothetical protein
VTDRTAHPDAVVLPPPRAYSFTNARAWIAGPERPASPTGKNSPHGGPAANLLRSAHGDGRLSLSECRALLASDLDLTDEQLEKLRDETYNLVEALLDAGGDLLSRQHEGTG